MKFYSCAHSSVLVLKVTQNYCGPYWALSRLACSRSLDHESCLMLSSIVKCGLLFLHVGAAEPEPEGTGHAATHLPAEELMRRGTCVSCTIHTCVDNRDRDVDDSCVRRVLTSIKR